MGGFASCVADEPDIVHDARPQAEQRAQAQMVGTKRQTAVRVSARERVAAPSAAAVERASVAPSTPASAAGVDPHANARICMDATPNGKDKSTFKFFCPICFMHYKEIYKSSCCNNYVCVPCALAHVTVGPVSGVCCPSCNSNNVALQPVSLHVQPRNYAESPHTRAMLAEVEQRSRQTLQGTAAAPADAGECNAPVRQTSFVLQRKILSFESVVDEGEEQPEQSDQPDQQEQEQQEQQERQGPEAEQLAEPSVSRTAAAAGLPPRRPLATNASASQPAPRAALRDVSNVQPSPAVAASDKLAVHGAASAVVPPADAALPTALAADSLPSIVPFAAHIHALPLAPIDLQSAAVSSAVAVDEGEDASFLPPLPPLLAIDQPIVA